MSQEKALSLFPSFPLSLHVLAALIPRQVLQWAGSVGSPCLIVFYIFNTYVMHFIRICCQSLSVLLYPITQIFFFFLRRWGILAPNKQLACILLSCIFLRLLSPCFFLCREFNYPGCCFMMLSWHPMTDSLSHLLAWLRSGNRTVASYTSAVCIQPYIWTV